ncbi:uncharacterized protein G2W53_022519 [Senna tora]|uniref:Uncharacterized protein n=1 Tax=Senna tora TaxID=362788 RepID=A0A834WI76_9FABA|nr:uncharacterized protein G2W53_022519 [Senna tora]
MEAKREWIRPRFKRVQDIKVYALGQRNKVVPSRRKSESMETRHHVQAYAVGARDEDVLEDSIKVLII